MIYKNLALRIEPELHKKIKIRAAEKGVSIKSYLMNLVKEDLKKEDLKKEKE